MDFELVEIQQFLAQYSPFDELSPQNLAQLPRQMAARYSKRGSTLVALGRTNSHMVVLQSGAVDIRDPHGALVERSEPGTRFGMSSVIVGGPSTYTMVATEDSLTYLMRAEVFHELIRTQPAFAQFFMTQKGGIHSVVEARSTSPTPAEPSSKPGSATL